jgi:hypothetical protein
LLDRFRSHLTYANVATTLALVIAVAGGTAYAPALAFSASREGVPPPPPPLPPAPPLPPDSDLLSFSFQSGQEQFSGKLLTRPPCREHRRILIKHFKTGEVVAKTRTNKRGRYVVHTDRRKGPWFAHTKPVTRRGARCWGVKSLLGPLKFSPGTPVPLITRSVHAE